MSEQDDLERYNEERWQYEEGREAPPDPPAASGGGTTSRRMSKSKMTMDLDWRPIDTAPDRVPVLTKIEDEHGVRNEQTLKRDGHVWWFTDMSMYVYYTPTHWAPLTTLIDPRWPMTPRPARCPVRGCTDAVIDGGCICARHQRIWDDAERRLSPGVDGGPVASASSAVPSKPSSSEESSKNLIVSLTALVAQWRASSQRWGSVRGIVQNECADELESLLTLTAPTTGETP